MVGSAAPSLLGAHQQLVDSPPVEIDHLELPALLDEAFALAGQMAEHRQRETGSSRSVRRRHVPWATAASSPPRAPSSRSHVSALTGKVGRERVLAKMSGKSIHPF